MGSLTQTIASSKFILLIRDNHPYLSSLPSRACRTARSRPPLQSRQNSQPIQSRSPSPPGRLHSNQSYLEA